jgi:hypothetical protein
MPMGSTVYVMRKMLKHIVNPNPNVKGAAFDYGGIELWAPMTGECYYFKLIQNNDSVLGISVKKRFHLEIGRLNDPICPLKHIFSVVDEKNLYANIQKYDLPVLMDFDFENKKHWKALFDPKASNAASLIMEPCVNDSPLKYARAMSGETMATLNMKIRNYLIA